jgi:tRNA nucleotidyltransferase/poly(A) polymerase
MENLRDRILANPLISAVFASPFEVYLVGGYLRDILRGFESKDIDFVVKGDFLPLLSRIASSTGGKIIHFEKGGLSRIILDTTTIDFTPLHGRLADDLSRRDFTVNAIAWAPEKGIIDPLEGFRDIQKGIIKAVSRFNLVSDPIRLIRSYRFIGEFGWRMDSKTRKCIKELKESLKLSSSERITLEFFKLLNSRDHLKALKLAYTDGLLNVFLSVNSVNLGINIKVLSRFCPFLEKIPKTHQLNLDQTFSQGLSYAGLLRAELILFKTSLQESKLRLSNAIVKRLIITNILLDQFEKTKPVNRQELFDFFHAAGDALLDFALLTRNKHTFHEAVRFLNIKSVLPTEEIMSLTGVKGGPELGSYLKEVKRIQFLGKIAERDDARRVLSQWLARRSNTS